MTKSYCVTVKLLRRQSKFTLPRFWVLKRWVNGKGTKLMLSLGWETVIIFGTFEKKNKEKKKKDKISQNKQAHLLKRNGLCFCHFYRLFEWSLFTSPWFHSFSILLSPFIVFGRRLFGLFFLGGGWLFFLIHFILCRISYIGMT